MKKYKIEFISLWDQKFNKSVYSCSICNMMGNVEPEIIGCSFDEIMKIFNIKGKELFSTQFSSEISTFSVGPLIENGKVGLLSGDINGNIRLMDTQGNLLWNTKVRTPVICSDIGDLNDDGKNEIALGLQNKKVIQLNEKGEIYNEFKIEEDIIDCTISEKSDKLIGNLIILYKSGKIVSLDKEGHWQEIIKLSADLTSMKFIKLPDTLALLIGTKEGRVLIYDYEGDLLGEFHFEEKIRCVNRLLPISEFERTPYITIATGSSLLLYELNQTDKLLKKEIPEKTTEKQKPVETKEKKATTIKKEKEIISSKGGIAVYRGGQVEGDRYIFKVKVENGGEFNITDVNIQILSYPYESLDLVQESSTKTYPDRIKIQKVTKGGFVSPQFIFLPKNDCIKGTIRAVVNFLNEKDEVETLIVEPYEIRVICGLFRPKEVSPEDFEKFSQDVVNFKHIGEEIEVNFEPTQLLEKLILLLKTKNFAIIDTERKTIGGKFFGILKAFAEGSYSKNQLGLQLTISGDTKQKKALIKIETYTEDKDMSPGLIAEIENSVIPQKCKHCGQVIPPELLKKILKNIETYCETCGESLNQEEK